ncbi:MAG: hypothetical protein ABRQ24_07185 [Syntrophomonadaceae bacterium]
MSRHKIMLVVLMVLLSLGPAGCGYDYRSLLPGAKTEETALIRVNIHFSDQAEVECYVKSLGVDTEAQVYSGGSSLNYMYDQDGNVMGSYNYHNVLYMKVLPDNPVSGD